MSTALMRVDPNSTPRTHLPLSIASPLALAFADAGWVSFPSMLRFLSPDLGSLFIERALLEAARRHTFDHAVTQEDVYQHGGDDSHNGGRERLRVIGGVGGEEIP